MILLKDVINYMKKSIDSPVYRASNGSFESDKSITVYDSKSTLYQRKLYGKRKYRTKSITILVHWGKNASEAEQKAMEVYNLFDTNEELKIGYNLCFFEIRTSQPVYIGVDKNGNIEYTIDVDIYIKE